MTVVSATALSTFNGECVGEIAPKVIIQATAATLKAPKIIEIRPFFFVKSTFSYGAS